MEKRKWKNKQQENIHEIHGKKWGKNKQKPNKLGT